MAEISAAAINDLPDSAFAYIEPGGEKDADGKTVPRTKRHFPIHDAAHVRNALARAPQSPFGEKAMAKIHAAAKKFGIEMGDDGNRSIQPADETSPRGPLTYDRTFDLDTIEILSRAKGGDGRTVEAYAAVFNVAQEIHDQHGDYLERNDPRAFNMTINSGAAKRALPLYNHGMSVVDGRPEAMYGVPLGLPLEIRADSRGLLTVTRYNKSPLAESILESVKNGDITSQSYRGRIFRSSPDRPRGGYRAKADGALTEVTRLELGLSDYGPTPRPYYADAAILSVRARDVAAGLAGLDEDERAELIRLLATTPNAPEPATATAIPAAGAEEPRESHSGRSKDLARQHELAMWAELAGMEMATRG